MERCFNSESVLVQFVDRHGDAAQSPEVAAAVRDKWLPYVATRLSRPLQRNRRPDRPMNKRAIRKLARLARRYENRRTTPLLKDVETTLWRAGEVADRRLGGYWPWGPVPLLPSDIEHWTSQNLGWSFPCAEGVSLIRRLIQSPCGRVIDIGAGRGLWTKVLKRVFGSDKVVGLPATLRRSTTPDDPSRLATDGAAGAAPRLTTLKASSLELSRLIATLRRPLSTLHDGRRRTPCKTRFRLAGCAFAGRESNPLGSVERFQINSSSFPGLRLALGQICATNNSEDRRVLPIRDLQEQEDWLPQGAVIRSIVP